MRWLLLGFVVCGLVLVAMTGSSGCLVRDPLYCHLPDHPCVDPARPVCDVNGQFEESDHIKNTCIPTPANCPVEICGCTPGDLITCDRDSAVRCGADGASSTSEACAMGCDSTIGGCKCTQGDSKCEAGAVEVCQPSGAFSAPTKCALGCFDAKRCVDISASNGLNAALDSTIVRQDFALGAGASFDTTSGTVLDGNGAAVLIPSVVVSQPAGGPGIRAFLAQSITLQGARVTGSNAFAIVANETIEISGTLDLRPSASVQGPGSSSGQCRGSTVVASGGGGSQFYSPGAGGGGHAVNGGSGGKWGPSLAGGSGGLVYGTAPVSPLLGGCTGGNVNDGNGAALAAGGLGGGAVQLVSRRAIRIVNAGGTQGAINAGGGGGRDNGGGGGAGGSVLLEAPTVLVDGAGVGVFVNGGASGYCGMPGQSGQSSTVAALNGCMTADDGGAGGTGTLPPAAGKDICNPPLGCNFSGFASGGGGAAGLLRVNTANGSFGATSGALISAHSSVGKIGVR